LMLAGDGRSLHTDLVCLLWAVAVAGFIGSRESGAPAAIERAPPQVPGTDCFLGLRQNGVCWALRASAQRSRRAEARQTRYRNPLAAGRLSGLLALEIAIPRRPTEDPSRNSPTYSRHEHRQSALGRTAHSRRTAQARYRGRADHGGKLHGQGDAHRRRVGRPSFTIMPTALRRWICLSCRRFRFGCCMDC
jgi:hypothetical protein